MVLLPCSSCCGCNICEHSPHDCLTLTLSGFDGPPGVTCNECKHLDGEYILRRFDQPATISASIVPSVLGVGSGAEIEASLSMDPATEEYTISGVTLKASGSGYTSGAGFSYSIKGAAASPCGGEPVVDVVVGRVQPSLTASIESPTGKSASLGVTISGPTGKVDEELWGVSGITIKSAGHSYQDQDKITFAIGKAAIEQSPAKASIKVSKSEPTVLASVEEVSDEYLTVTLAVKEEGVWEVDEVDVQYYGGPRVANKDVTFALSGYGVELEPATAKFSATGKVSSISILDGGSGYKTPPSVVLSGGSGSGAAAAATIRGGVGALTLKSGGSGYTENPTVSFSGGGGSGAMAAAYVDAGQVTKLSLTSPGFGYESAPTVTISGGGGSGASATASIDGSVISLDLLSQGSGYTEPPTVSFSGGGGSDASASTQIEGMDLSVSVTAKGEYYGGGQIESITIDDEGEYYLQDGVKSVTVEDGGSFYPTPFCEYTWRGCAACCNNGGMDIVFVAGGEQHTLTARTRGQYNVVETIFDAATPSDGGDWTSMTFDEDSFFPGVASIAVNAGGSGYTSAPTVSISGGGGSGAEATATVRGYVDSITLTDGGDGYWANTPLTVTISGGGGTGATASAFRSFGKVTTISLGSGGNGYTSVPTVTISGGGGSGATATATVRQAVESVTVTKQGSGYSSVPSVSFSGGGGTGAAATATLTRQPVGCQQTGTAEITAATCTDEDDIGRELPDQISLTLTGIAPIFYWASQNGGSPGMAGCAGGGNAGWGNVFCGQCNGAPENGIRYQITGNAVGPAGYALGQAIENFTAVLDRQNPESCNPIVYAGAVPTLPTAGFTVAGFNSAAVSCGGDLTSQVSFSLGCVLMSVSVSISAPTKTEYPQTATAEITGVGAGGAISGIMLTDGGEGYAREIFERVEPEVVAGVSTTTGSGVELDVTLTKVGDGENAYWTVSDVTVVNGGSGYHPNDSVGFSTSDEFYLFASGHITMDRVEPTVTAEAPGGDDASLSVTLSEETNYYGASVWRVSSIDVDDGGTGYTDGASVDIEVTDGIEATAASAVIRTFREEPTVGADVAAYYSGGSGATFSVSLTQSGNSWYVSGVTVTNGGSGYDSGSDYLFFTTSDSTVGQAYGSITTDGYGVITGVTVLYGGSYYRATDVIESVEIQSQGEYFKPTGVISGVVVEDGGYYWRNEATGTVDADEPVVSILGAYDIGGGATATAVVDTTIGSPSFGTITSLTLTSGGSGYRNQGSGWQASVGIGGLIHRTECLVAEDAPMGACSQNDAQCPGFSAAWRVPQSDRTVADDFPHALLNKGYKMAFSSSIFPGADLENAAGVSYCRSGFFGQALIITDMGGGDIVAAVAPA